MTERKQTAEEVADSIFRRASGLGPSASLREYGRDQIEVITSEITTYADSVAAERVNKAKEEAYGIAYDMFVSAGIPIIYAQGKREAYADAAKIADQTPSMNFGAGIAKEIRARAALINDKDYDKNNVGG